MIRLVPAAAELAAGHRCGRAMLAEALHTREIYEPGDSGRLSMPFGYSWSDADLALGCLWLRTVMQDTARVLDLDPLALKPTAAVRDRPTMAVMRAWELAHHFMAGMRPYCEDTGGIEICCRDCLYLLTCCTALSAAACTEMDFHQQRATAEAYVREGRPLPAHGTALGCDSCPPGMGLIQ